MGFFTVIMQRQKCMKDLNFARKIFVKIKSIAGHNLVEYTRYLKAQNIFFITLLRDPLIRSASRYQDHVQRGNE